MAAAIAFPYTELRSKLGEGPDEVEAGASIGSDPQSNTWWTTVETGHVGSLAWSSHRTAACLRTESSPPSLVTQQTARPYNPC
jgi:hypothetical protein